MKLPCALSLVFLTSVVTSQDISSDTRVCQEFTVPVTVTSQVFITEYPAFQDSYDVVGFVNNIAGRDSNTTFAPLGGRKNVTASYTIGATICNPKGSGGKNKTLLLATPGLGYDRRYWDSEVDPANYSFVDFAISQGYSVFFYDRLGTGESSKVSGYNDPQAQIQLAILQQLTSLLRAGKYTGVLGVPGKLVHVGHSFGSFLSNALVATTPELSDAAILTGIAYGSASMTFMEAWGLRIATQIAPGRWNNRDNGYLTWVDAFGNAAVFFYPGSYDTEVLWYTEDAKQPLAAIELLTPSALRLRAVGFTSPVMIISGEFDFAVCDGDCRGLLASAKEEIFPNATDFQAVVHPGVGHAINFSYNATGAYGIMLEYLKRHEL
ncbi:alpha/beta-hydrolase [Hyaloscypha variabilis]